MAGEPRLATQKAMPTWIPLRRTASSSIRRMVPATWALGSRSVFHGSGFRTITPPTAPPILPTLQSAVARGASVLLGFNPTVALSSSNYASLASYDVAKIQYFQAQGITISAVSPVNEPQYMGNGSTTAAEIDTFIADYLWPAMNSAGVGSIPLIMPENSGWFATDYATACINDYRLQLPCSRRRPAWLLGRNWESGCRWVFWWLYVLRRLRRRDSAIVGSQQTSVDDRSERRGKSMPRDHKSGGLQQQHG